MFFNGKISFFCPVGLSFVALFIVKNKETEKLIDWGDVNLPLSEESFEVLESAVKKEMEQKDLFVFDGYAGADERYRLPLRVVTMMAWQGHFSHNMFCLLYTSPRPRD